jgi:prepilin-type N-terminal cleavage/methylation domain-containing protein
MNKNGQDGFTLLELLISFSLVAILLLGAAQLTLYSVQIKRTSDCILESAELASEKLEYLKSLPFECEELQEQIAMESIESQKRSDLFLREYRIHDISTSIKKIEVECFSSSLVRRKVGLLLLYSKALGF